MAMDALRNLVNNIPDWQTKLDELSSQITKRQAELAAVAAAEGKSFETRSIRNQGSTESLKPKDDGPMHGTLEMEPATLSEGTIAQENRTRPSKPSTPPENSHHGANPDVPGAHDGAGSPGRLLTQARDAQAAVHSRAAAQAKKKRRSASAVSAEGANQAYRTRSMIIVYYDSKVQDFFDSLVRFVSSSRNLMRKAKMAAKVAHIKRLAEMELPDDDPNGDGLDALPSLRYMSSRRMGGPLRSLGGPPGAKDQPPDVYDKLDKTLDAVQMTCEHGAHQFLRDADCNEELRKIQARMAEAYQMAKEEMERVERDEPELAKETGDVGKARTCRPISMRRELSATLKEDLGIKLDVSKLEAAKPPQHKSSMDNSGAIIEADEGMEADEGIDMEQEMPMLKFRSTRYMRSRPAQP
ncbi:hypothetical protein S40285_08435 [Stachybotrys chlorohalonatus IBT 40285]|uniref:Uncharacterized protein n=1 Tax=Stachybotrys chlorohalonatus (strain IBT 40285) TaxID=1283841 RepID=A0A084QGJ5_STAC4|nr:hypothetical protein S40285_08435 [Stachybotrys chlorohalonata IBT 40285]